MTKKTGSKSQDLPKERCQEHHGERLTTYCADHDVICCNTCVAVTHRNCGGISYILKAAEGIKTSKELGKAQSDTATAMKEVKKMKTGFQNHLTTLDDDRTSNIKEVRDYTEWLIKRIKDTVKMAIDQIELRYKEVHVKVLTDVRLLDDMISAMKESLEKLRQYQQYSDSQVFADVKQSQRLMTEVNRRLQEKGRSTKPCIKYVTSADIEYYLNHLNLLGTFDDESKVYKAKQLGVYTVKTKEDKDTCNVTTSCLLLDMTIVLTDWNNECLKRLNSSYNVIGRYEISGQPWGVVSTVPTDVAVTITYHNNVQFVSVREPMSLTRSFSTSDRCRGICFSNGELFVSCGGLTAKGFKEGPGHIAVYSLTGAHLRTIQTHPSGQLIFSLPIHITASMDGTMIHVAQDKGDVVVLNRNGDLLHSYDNRGLVRSRGICTLRNNHTLVCGRDSNNVLQFDKNGKKVAELLKEADGIKLPKSLCCDVVYNRLILTMSDCSKIKVFDLM